MTGLKNIGSYMRFKREEAGMDVATLADITRVPERQIMLIEQGDPKCEFEMLVLLGWWFRVRIAARVRNA